ncbi:hypothetical protein [Natrinema marinum]|uniref:hypothetical protein n=1 Tax=Natrinema marinum TaxID=2961598 RepID=UPI0020C83420|nr:hypothetical protein [Natrinema marinum]
MIRNVIASLILGPLSRLAGLVGSIGRYAPIHRAYWWIFDRIIGVEDARKWREDHVGRIAEYVSENIEIEASHEDLVAEVEENWRQTESHFSDGESVLALAVAGAGLLAPPLVAMALAVLLAISVSVRLTAVEVLAYTDPDPKAPREQLFAEAAWNGSVLDGKNVTGSLITLRLMNDLNNRVYERWLDEVFIPALSSSGWSKSEGLKRFFDVCMEELVHKREFEGDDTEEETEESEENDEDAAKIREGDG